MGWSIDIKADKNIEIADVVKVLSDYADHDMSRFPSKQAWGWPGDGMYLPVDVNLPDGNTLGIRGAWYSAKHGEPFAKDIADRLTKLGYTLTIGALDG